ncbi:hypothetical protein N9R54_00880 [Pelobium sp.]|nr:hypothetical protein [Pelobium sp.]MDA9554764.1 hypothetical protein [Pelobium sp.]
MLKFVQQRLEKPLVIIAQDASASIKASYPKGFNAATYHQDLKQLVNDLQADDYEVKVLHFGDAVKPNFDFSYTAQHTDYAELFNYIKEQYSDRNVGALVLASDGIINKGVNPIFDVKNSRWPVYTIALGDSIPKKDLILSKVNYNNLVYLGNDHQIEIQVSANKAKGVSSILNISTNDGQNKNIAFKVTQDEWYQTFTINLETRKKGIQKINISVKPISGELSTQNNTQTIFVDVLDGREKVLILADAPHPDISAIKQAIESNKNYEVKVAFADAIPSNTKDYGLIIFHSLPSFDHPITQFLAQTSQQSRWFIVGPATNTSALSQQQNLINISSVSKATEEYLPQLNQQFYAFSLSDETKAALSVLAPLTAPYGNYSLKTAGVTLFSQQVGQVTTNAPLLSFGNDGGVKTAVLTGEGIWRWCLEDFEKHENHQAVDELITKSVQYLSAKEDKRKFRVYASKNRFSENEHVILNAELYNDAYELVNTPDVSINLKSEGKNYSFLFSKQGKSYQLDAGFLPSGVYSFDAKTKLGNQNYSAKGEFLIEQLQVELLQTTANHQLLYNLSAQSDGKMVYPSAIRQLSDELKKNEKIKTVSFEEKHYDNFINLKWVFAVIIALLSLEWFLRKRNGAV